MNQLLSKRMSENPLWLSVACEELKLHADSKTLGEYIDSLPDALLEWVPIVIHSIITRGLSKRMSENPLWLSVACEELKLHTDSKTLGEYIDSLPDALLEWVSIVIHSIITPELSKRMSENPLWLSVACEELKLHTDTKTLGEYIDSLPDALLEWVSSVTHCIFHVLWSLKVISTSTSLWQPFWKLEMGC